MTLSRAVKARLLAGSIVVAATTSPTIGDAKLTSPQRDALVHYLSDLEHREYAGAFGRLSADERRYFRSAHNLEAVFTADRVRLAAFTVVASTSAGTRGAIAVVRERVSFFDHAHQRADTLTANVRYGIVPGTQGFAIKDPFHPWYAFAPAAATARANGIRVWIRKLSFYTGRVAVLATFANTSDRTVTILPYGRSLVRDDTGRTHAPIRSRLPGLTDATLYKGLLLPPSAQYTGEITFFTADRFRPKYLRITFAPALVDGADAPFEWTLPVLPVPAAS